jgi:hypothetical protein
MNAPSRSFEIVLGEGVGPWEGGSMGTGGCIFPDPQTDSSPLAFAGARSVECLVLGLELDI